MTQLLGLRFAVPAFDAPDRLGFIVRPDGRPDAVVGLRATRQSILLLLSTVPGERVMRPEYGCRIHELAFAPNDDTTAGLAMHFVRRAVERWVPSAEVVAVDAHRDEAAGSSDGTLVVRLDYRHRELGLSDLIEVRFALDRGM